MILFGGVFFAFSWTLGPPVPLDLLNRIRTGMSQEQVRGMLGEPESVSEHGDWYYSPWGNQGWVTIGFDESGAVARINNESVW